MLKKFDWFYCSRGEGRGAGWGGMGWAEQKLNPWQASKTHLRDMKGQCKNCWLRIRIQRIIQHHHISSHLQTLQKALITTKTPQAKKKKQICQIKRKSNKSNIKIWIIKNEKKKNQEQETEASSNPSRHFISTCLSNYIIKKKKS